MQVEHVQVSLFPCVDVDSGIRTGCLVRASVRTFERSAFRSVLLLEKVQAAVGDYALAGLVDEPAQHVEVVAGLCEDDGRGLLGTAPVAADVGVCHVGILDGLHVLDAHDISYCTAAQHLTHGDEVRSVAQHMAYCHYPAKLLCLGEDCTALLFCLCARLFEQNVVSEFQSLHAGLEVTVVRSGDHHCVRQLPARGEYLAEVAEPHLGCHSMLVGQELEPVIENVGDTHDLHGFGEQICIFRISLTATAGADDDDADGFVDISSQRPDGKVDAVEVVPGILGELHESLGGRSLSAQGCSCGNEACRSQKVPAFHGDYAIRAPTRPRIA